MSMEKASFDFFTGDTSDEVVSRYNLTNNIFKLMLINTRGVITKDPIGSYALVIALGYKTKSVMIKSDHPEYSKVVDLISNNLDFPSNFIRELFLSQNKKAKVTNYIKNTDIQIRTDGIYYKNTKMTGKLIDQILKAIKNKKRVKYLINFLDKLMQNTSYHIHTRLFDFLEHNDIEIQGNGDFVAYKNIRNDFTDVRTGTFDNSVGSIVKMDRNLVDDNDAHICSSGLHVAAKSYLKYYSWFTDGRTIMVKVNPKNVVSIPTDYHNAKMRTCEYLVLKETTKNGE